MKKYLLQFSVLIGILILGQTVSANEIGITIDGKSSFLENKAFISGDRTYVPMRELFENIGATVIWEDETKSATAKLNNTSITFGIDSNKVVKDGKIYLSDNNCRLIDGKTYVPLRIILELLGFNVTWDEDNENVNISTPPSNTPELNGTTLPENSDNPTDSNSTFELKVLELINNERSKNELGMLIIDESLSNVARTHSRDMYNRNFFSHTNPDGLSPFDRIKNYGITYRYAAENIAAGQATPEEVVASWMNSEGHRKNILNSNFTKIGIGYYKSSNGYVHYWTQCFTD